MLAGPPPSEVPVPSVVGVVAAGRPVRPVWENELGGLTFEVGHGTDRCFVKWAPAGTGQDLVDEAARMRWLRAHSSAPEVLDAGTDDSAAGGTWLVTTPLPGRSAVDEHWKRDPATAVAVIGAGLRHLHDHAPVATCPYDWSAERRVAVAQERIDAGLSRPEGWSPEHRHLTVGEALERLTNPPEVDRLVVCHSDACAPNTVINDDGTWSGHVDLGALGVADRWADLAIATWSTEWNYGPDWEDLLLAAYGVEPDPARTAYYRLLWDLT